ncbi:hypothetical protein BRC91_09370 [Halobacteriales archaeon QS_4_62_28]|nr:MAG: hypothetical protein BRC91_09370 [Halobacteriales archaeon QS_4_62_28]
MTEQERPWPQITLAFGGVCWTGWSLTMFATGATTGPIRAFVGFSGLVLAVGLLGVVLRLPWIYKFPGGEGSGIALVGGLVFAIGQWLTLLVDGDVLVELLIALGVLALVGGTLLLAIALLRARRTPPWIGVALIVGTILFLGFSDGEGLTTLLAIPLGLSWISFGWYLQSNPEQPTEHLEPSALRR